MEYVEISHDAPASQKAALNDLLVETFNFTLEPWDRRGGWTGDYTAHALFDGGRAVANVSLYRMDLLFGGSAQEWFQVGAVTTRLEYRGRGLSRALFERIFDRMPEARFFLFPNPSVMEFYPRFGFNIIHDREPVVDCKLEFSSGKMRPLLLDDPLVSAYLRRRAPLSPLLDCANAAPILLANLVNEFSQSLYEVPSLGVMVVAEQEGTALRLYDVISDHPVDFSALAPCLNFPGAEQVIFGFNPGWMGVTPRWEPGADDAVFVRGDWPLRGDWTFPGLLNT